MKTDELLPRCEIKLYTRRHGQTMSIKTWVRVTNMKAAWIFDCMFTEAFYKSIRTNVGEP